MSERTIGIGMIGCGTVGKGVLNLLEQQAPLYHTRTGARLELRRVLVRDPARHPHAQPDRFTSDPEAFFDTPDMPIVIEVAGGAGAIRDHIERALRAGKHVITANKSLLAAHGPELYRLAAEHRVAIAFEASCGGGIPIITATQFGLMANRVSAIYGILNGTCNFILTQMSELGQSYADALSDAQQRGYAEADPTLDITGRDAGQKLAILASLAFGVCVEEEDVWCEGIEQLEGLDMFLASELGYVIKLLAIAELDDRQRLSLRVHPCFVHEEDPIASVDGSFNAVSVYGHAVGHTMYLGRGAGQMPTASAVVSDLINIVSGAYPQAFSQMKLWHPTLEAKVQPKQELRSRYYLRFNALDVPGVVGKVTSILGDAGISISGVIQHEQHIGQFVALVITTHHASEGAIEKACADIDELDCIDGQPRIIRILDLPEG